MRSFETIESNSFVEFGLLKIKIGRLVLNIYRIYNNSTESIICDVPISYLDSATLLANNA